MDNFRSMSCREGRPELESSNGGNADHSNWGHPSNMQDLRSYSTSYASCSSYAQNPNLPKNQNHNQADIKTGRRSNSSKAGGWSLSDPEMQRKKRVASYKVYSVEGKMKGSLRKSFRWIKNTCSQVVHGWR